MENCEVYAALASQEHGGTMTPPLQLSPNCERNVTIEEISGPKIGINPMRVLSLIKYLHLQVFYAKLILYHKME